MTPNPKTSGGARWNYLAAWAWARSGPASPAGRKPSSPPCSSTCRCSTAAPAARPSASPNAGLGDVLLTWENEAYLVLTEYGADKFDIVTPSFSILAEPPVALVDKNVDRHGPAPWPRPI
jgi:ABC-type sulfate transport system substrate-binding protein